MKAAPEPTAPQKRPPGPPVCDLMGPDCEGEVPMVTDRRGNRLCHKHELDTFFDPNTTSW